MDVQVLLKDRNVKAKEKTLLLAQWLLSEPNEVNRLVEWASVAKDADRATCIEAIELASKEKPGLVTAVCFDFMVQQLAAKAPRVKWESAKVIGNTVHLYPAEIGNVVRHLLDNTTHHGTVVRWSAAYALGEILKLGTKLNKDLVPAVGSVCAAEEKNSIKKIYLDALKKTKTE